VTSTLPQRPLATAAREAPSPAAAGEATSGQKERWTRLGHAGDVWRGRLALPTAGLLLVASASIAILAGPTAVGPREVLATLLHHLLGLSLPVGDVQETIVWEIRLPRVLLAGLVGATLALAGGAYQGVFRNPLADPYLLGVAAGAGFAAALVIVAPIPFLAGQIGLLPVAAFLGALAAVAVTYRLARVGGSTAVATLILAGVAVSSLAVAATSYLMLADRRDTISILTWLMGGFNGATWAQLPLLLPYALPAGIVIVLHGRLLNVLQLGDEEAQQAGVDVERTRLAVLLSASLATAAAVSVAGIVGFVGLIVPHVARLLGGPDYRRLLPLAVLLGAAFLVLADLVARTLVSPGELPVGVVTATLGSPFFLYLLRRQRRTLG
jgi:iron complex transport system permease protein